MRRICDTYGDQVVRAWVHANLDSAYSATRTTPALKQPTPNKVFHSEGGGTVLLDRKNPSTAAAAAAEDSDSGPEETPQPVRRPAPKAGWTWF